MRSGHLGWLLAVLLSWPAAPLRSAWAEEEPPPERFTGTYLQLGGQHGTWREEDWRRLFEYLHELRLSQLIVQWTLYEGGAFFPSEIYPTVAHPPLETILRLADEAAMEVWVGLAHEESYWTDLEKEADLLEVDLQSMKVRSLQAAGEALTLVRDHPSFEGWYIPQEIDDVNWLAPERRRVLFDFLRDLTASLRALTPERSIALSGFTRAHADPEALGRFWADLVGASDVDVVLFQDGIGVGNLDLRHLPLYLSAVRESVEREEGEFWVVVENFRQIGGPPIDEGTFRAVPASMDRLDRQLAIASRFSSGAIIAFSVPEYMSPLGTSDALRLFDELRRRWKR